MTISRLRAQGSKSAAWFVLATAFMVPVGTAVAEDRSVRIDRAVAVLTESSGSSGHIRAEQLASADCVAIIPGFKKGAAVVGVGFGKGFISCRVGDGWSAPAAVTFQGESVGVQLGGEKIDIVILSMDKQYRSKLLSNRFTFGSDASAAWESGKSAHGDPNAKMLFFGKTKGVFAGFDLDGTTLEADASTNKALYGRALTNNEIVNDGTVTPATVQPLVTKLASLLHPESASGSSSPSLE